MKVIVIMDPDPDCIDPKDNKREPRTHVRILEGDVFVLGGDVVGDPDSADGHPRWVQFGDGVFEHLTIKQVRKVLRKLGVA